MQSGKLIKMVIEAYEQPDFTAKVGEFTFQVNPENYSRQFNPASDDSGQILSNGETVPANFALDLENLSLTFYLDSTGVIPGCDDVQSEVDKLKTLCLDVNGNIHRANYLKVRWGTSFVFPCVMKSLSVDFILFKPNGSPVRAKLNASFQEFVDADTKAKQNNNSSPDLSHVRTVIEGDTLVNLCYDIYGDTKYYLHVAEYNNLTNIKYLKPGINLTFPPLEHAKFTTIE